MNVNPSRPPGDKSGLRRLVDQSALHYFARLAYRRGHGPTNFTRWLDALEPYTVPYADNYEPWFIISRWGAGAWGRG